MNSSLYTMDKFIVINGWSRIAVMGSWRPLSGEIVNSSGQGKCTIAI